MVKQVANKLLKRHHLAKEADTKALDGEFGKFLGALQRNGNNLTFPPFFVHSVDLKKGIVKCESFKISCS